MAWTDRQAADAVRDRVSWKFALGLGLDDAGFDASVLSEFRSRLVAGDLATLALDALLERLVAEGLVKARGRARTDSTHVLGAIRHLCRLELAGETLRAALAALASAAPDWLTGMIDASWQVRYGARVDNLHLPESRDETRGAHGRLRPRRLPPARTGRRAGRAAVATRDPRRRHAAPDLDPAVLPDHHVEGCGGVRRRESESEGGDGLPPGRDRLISPYDLDARHSVKRDHGWDGYKVHFTETCDDPSCTPTPADAAGTASGPGEAPVARPARTGRGDLPNLIIGVLTTVATTSALAAARAEQTTDEWKRRYAARAGIEGTMRQTTHVTGVRTARYLGLPRQPSNTPSPQPRST